jgi:hypothetical protein
MPLFLIGLLPGLLSLVSGAAAAAAQVTVAIWGFASAVAPSILAAVFGAVSWLWTTIFFPGLKDILDDWVTIVTVGALAVLLWFFIATHSVFMVNSKGRELNQCRTELAHVRKRAAPADEPELKLGLPWPLSMFSGQ